LLFFRSVGVLKSVNPDSKSKSKAELQHLAGLAKVNRELRPIINFAPRGELDP
jgi:hypothetical protein